MITIDEIELVRERSNRASPFDPADEKPLRRFIERMIGEGFAMVVVRGERPNGLEDVVAWFQAECERVQSQMLQVNLGQFTFDNPWLELDQTIGKIAATEKTILFLHGIDPLSEKKRHDEVPLFRQLNVQRDALTRDYRCFWVIYIPPRLDYEFNTQAPDFCDFVGYWCTIQPSDNVISRIVSSYGSNLSYSSPSGTPEYDARLLAALGDEHLFASLKAAWDWKLDEARGQIAIYEMSSKRNGHPGAFEFVRGYLQFQEGNRQVAETSYNLANDKIDEHAQPQLKAELDTVRGQFEQSQGKSEKALEHYRSALVIFERNGDVRSKAAIARKIADILQLKGDLDAALQMLQNEALKPILGLGLLADEAVYRGSIANILQQRGQIDEALRIYRDECIPVYERLGDVRLKAVTMGNIVDILLQRDETEEALRNLEAIKIIFHDLGDVRSKTATMGKIADILQKRGQIEEALRIRREEELPVYERLGDVREKAVTMGNIALILEQRGEIHEAIRIYREIVPILESLNDLHSQMNCRYNFGTALLSRGYKKDIPIAHEHLRWALATAEKHQYAEAAQIRANVTRLLGGSV